MYARRLTFFLGAAVLPVLLVGCGALGGSVDTDGDGLTDKEEEELGTDPALVDTDGDGLSDLEERDLGTDGTQYDTDGDGYSDYEESLAGSDPTDEDDVIYEGGWPYNADKDSIDGEPLGERIRIGETIGRFIGFDQHGDEVDLYDFAGHGRMVAVDTSALDCGPCVGMSMWLGGRWTTTEYAEWMSQGENSTFLDNWDSIPTAVQNGDLYWVTVMYESFTTLNPTGANGVTGWDSDYGHSNIPVLTTNQDGDDTAFGGDDGVSYDDGWITQINGGAFPHVTLLDENLAVIKNSSPRSGYGDTLDEISSLLSGDSD